jgi:hypothetical protein
VRAAIKQAAGWFTGRLGLDARALAAWRIAAGALLLIDLCWRALELEAFYTDRGILPRAALAALELPVLQNLPSWSLHAVSGAWGWQAALFVVAALCAVGLMLGWRTRWMCVASWLLLTSLHAHNPVALYRGDAALRLLLFWSMWLPLGARWSLDARRAGDQTRAAQQATFVGAASLAITAQWALLYLASVLHKRGPAWREDGLAVYYALQLDDFCTAAGAWLGRLLWEQPAWSAPLTYGTLALEIAAPLLLLVPWRVAQARGAAILMASALHLGLLITMRLDLFTWVMLSGWLIFIPGAVFDRGAAPAPAASPAAAPSNDPAWSPVLAALVVCVAVWSVGDLWPPQPIEALRAPLRAAGLAQRWSMFSPDPARDDGWIVAAATLADGRVVDLATGHPPDDQPPARRDADNLRWRSYQLQLSRDSSGVLADAYLVWLCRRTPAGARSVSLTFEQEYTMGPGERPARSARALGERGCDPRRSEPQP